MGKHNKPPGRATYETTRRSGFGFRWEVPINRHPDGKPVDCRCEPVGQPPLKLEQR